MNNRAANPNYILRLFYRRGRYMFRLITNHQQTRAKNIREKTIKYNTLSTKPLGSQFYIV